MTIIRFKQHLIRLQERINSDRNRRRMVAVTSIVILITFLFSVFIFTIDLTYCISQEQEELILLSQSVKPALEEETEKTTETKENGYGFASPQGAATPVPMNQP